MRTLLTPTQNLIEILPGIDRTMKVLIAGRGLGKAAVVVGDEVGQKRVCRLDRADAGESQLLHQTILLRMMRALDATLRLAGIGTQNLDVKFRQRPSELGVRRDKAALSSGCKSHPATAPAGSNRSSYGGNEIAEAFGMRVTNW